MPLVIWLFYIFRGKCVNSHMTHNVVNPLGTKLAWTTSLLQITFITIYQTSTTIYTSRLIISSINMSDFTDVNRKKDVSTSMYIPSRILPNNHAFQPWLLTNNKQKRFWRHPDRPRTASEGHFPIHPRTSRRARDSTRISCRIRWRGTRPKVKRFK